MNVKLPGGREVTAPWSNLAPCGMISERLAEILQLQQLPLKSSRKDMCMTAFGGFGGSKEQWCYVKELDVSLTVQRVGSSNLRGAESDCRTSRRESKELLPSCFRG